MLRNAIQRYVLLAFPLCAAGIASAPGTSDVPNDTKAAALIGDEPVFRRHLLNHGSIPSQGNLSAQCLLPRQHPLHQLMEGVPPPLKPNDLRDPPARCGLKV